jgi:hypothetical protein
LWLDATTTILSAPGKRCDLFSGGDKSGSGTGGCGPRHTRLSFSESINEIFSQHDALSAGCERNSIPSGAETGIQTEDVKHIIQTHLHLDHAGGLLDFPHAHIHVLKAEHEHAMSHKSWEYHPEHWEHRPHRVLHETKEEKWYEFDALKLKGFEPEIWLAPLTGHTPAIWESPLNGIDAGSCMEATRSPSM